MTSSAWGMLLSVWGVVITFCGYFLWRVLTLPRTNDESNPDGQ